MPVPLLVAGGAQALGGIIGGITGLSQKRKAKKMLNQIGEQPSYSIPKEILNNQKMAEQATNEGLPSQQYNNAMKKIQRSQANTLSGAMDRRSALMALPKIQQQTNDAYGNLDAADANARMQNQRTLYGIGTQTAQYKDKAFQLNQLQPWQRKYDYAMQLQGAGNQNFIGGLDKIAGGIGTAFGGDIGGLFGGYGGPNRKMKAGNVNDPTYYNGYGTDSTYSGFETGY